MGSALSSWVDSVNAPVTWGPRGALQWVSDLCCHLCCHTPSYSGGSRRKRDVLQKLPCAMGAASLPGPCPRPEKVNGWTRPPGVIWGIPRDTPAQSSHGTG